MVEGLFGCGNHHTHGQSKCIGPHRICEETIDAIHDRDNIGKVWSSTGKEGCCILQCLVVKGCQSNVKDSIEADEMRKDVEQVPRA